MRKLMAIAATAALSLTAAPTLAQNSGLVVVDLSNADVLNNLARDLDVNVSNIPVNVQVPVGVAAAVCDVNANVLAQQRKTGTSTCKAKNTSTALNQAVQRQITRQ